MFIDQRFANNLMRVRREVRLPENAVGGFSVTEGQSIDIRSKVGRVMIPNRHVIIEAAQELGLRNINALHNLMLVQPNKVVAKDTALAGKDPKRGKRVLAPSDGLVVWVGNGRIIFQEKPEFIDYEAGVRGIITSVSEKKVAIETTGALLTGVWGNGPTVIATLRLEPMGGVDVMATDVLDSAYRNEIVVSSRPLTYATFGVMEARAFAGIIAPGMDVSLLPLAEKTPRAIMLTDGFGAQKMNTVAYEFLKEFDSNLGTLNASKPTRANLLRPELVINRLNDDSLKLANPYEGLRPNARVRVTRDPYMGQAGKVTDISKMPQLLDSGLRAIVATVSLTNTGQVVKVPLANLEAIGG
jgi:hypothetical protein